jgi:hypothetical protein
MGNMDLARLSDNAAVVTYLHNLAARLEALGRNEDSVRVRRASLFANGSSSEFLHETHVALRHVRQSSAQVLSELELAQIARVIRQVDDAFAAVGGA